MAALVTTATAVALYGLVFFITLLWFRWEGVPRSVGLIQPLLFLLMVGASRTVARVWLSGRAGRARAGIGRLLIYGAGEAGVQTASALGFGNNFVLLGFLDDDAAKKRIRDKLNRITPEFNPTAPCRA